MQKRLSRDICKVCSRPFCEYNSPLPQSKGGLALTDWMTCYDCNDGKDPDSGMRNSPPLWGSMPFIGGYRTRTLRERGYFILANGEIVAGMSARPDPVFFDPPITTNMICTICLNIMDKIEEISVLTCGHLFHTQCVQKSFRHSKVCPRPTCAERIMAMQTAQRAYIGNIFNGLEIIREAIRSTLGHILPHTPLSKSDPRWHPNTQDCESCHFPFGFFARRHHCRKCGSCVCNNCLRSVNRSEGQIPLCLSCVWGPTGGA